MLTIDGEVDTVRASRAGHTFHERWAARRALQLVFPNDNLFAIAVEGLSSTETANPGSAAAEVADLVLYYGDGDNFTSCDRLETVQFKYKVREEEVTSSFLKKTIGKFCDTLVGYENEFPVDEIDRKVSFIFVTNAPFTKGLWDAVVALKDGTMAPDTSSRQQVSYLTSLCTEHGVDPQRLFARIEFRAAERSLSGQSSALRRTLVDWSAGADAQAKNRLHDLQELVLKKAGLSGQQKNLIKREDVLNALDCLPEDLFPADTRFIDIGAVIERAELAAVSKLVEKVDTPVFLHAEGGVGKTVFVQSLASKLIGKFEIVVFDCFGGGAYRSKEHARHLPSIGIVQIVNELASRGLCDLLLPGSDDTRKLLRAARKRFAQAVTTIKTQSEKRGLLIIIDAADNAQLEAEHRHEDAFPTLLLSSLCNEPVDGVKLLLTARTHRKDSVIARAKVEQFELGPFTEAEARQFLEDRRRGLSAVEFATAVARSGRNARVLDYLVQTWDVNVKDAAAATQITVPEIIAQQCENIFSQLHTAGWPECEVCEFFVALSLLPPPIPLHDLASALGWSASQVNTAASDLAPMLEITLHGAIFRDEPTETYIRDTYAGAAGAQRAIADRLVAAQVKSTYAAEALPHFLFVIGDSDRAFALAESTEFPAAIQSEFGRRRLTLARLRAAFRLAVVDKHYDRILNVTMRLAQAATANMRGDEFIRRSPALAVTLGDPDAQRRLFADRSGWRGARSARLTISHSFSGDRDEALIQCESTIRWINWYSEQPRYERLHDIEGPGVSDFAAVLFQTALQGGFRNVDSNLAGWDFRFSLSASDELLRLLQQYELTTGATVLSDFVSFVASDECISLALKMRLLSFPCFVSRTHARSLAKSLERLTTLDEVEDDDGGGRAERGVRNAFVEAALAALFLGSRASSKAIIKRSSLKRPSGYDYTEKFGPSKAWRLVLGACVQAWSRGKKLSHDRLLPNELKVTKRARAIGSKRDLTDFLREQLAPARRDVPGEKRNRKQIAKPKARYRAGECDEISAGIEMILAIIAPIQSSVLSKEPLSTIHVAEFVNVLKPYIQSGVHWRSETSIHLLARAIGLGCIELVFTHAVEISSEQAEAMVSMISSDRFGVRQKLLVLEQLARRPVFNDLAGRFAQDVSEQIRKDEHIGSRAELYSDLASALVPMSIDEAQAYYRQGLAQLDQMGGEDYQQIYSLLHYAAKQPGGPVAPVLAQRLMNLCEVILHDEPSKFGWTLFGRAASMSIGLPAIAKLVRWDNQEVAPLSYGLPQLACFLASGGRLSAERAAFLVTICEDHGWWDWQVGEGLSDVLGVSKVDGQRPIVKAVLEKLYLQHTSVAWPSLWESLIKAGTTYPQALTSDEQDALRALRDDAKRVQDEYNSRNNSPPNFPNKVDDHPTKEEMDEALRQLVGASDHTSATSVDEALRKIAEDDRHSFGSQIEFISQLRGSCPYGKRLEFLFAVCDATEWEFDRSVDTLIDSVADWKSSSAHLASNTKKLVARLFDSKGGDIFYEGYSNISKRIHKLSQFCGDERFVLDQVLTKVAAEEIELDGDEWLQLATSLCNVASGDAARLALEVMLSGPASRIADEIGQGVLRPEQEITTSESNFLADLLWHLLGDDDAYVRWNVARGLSTLIDLGLVAELVMLLDRFDVAEIPALASTGRMLPYQNSQEWLLIGIARAALIHGSTLAFLRPRLVTLANRDDVHVMHKVHIARCLENIGHESTPDAELQALRAEIDAPRQGIIVSDSPPAAMASKSGFVFDYEFNEIEIARAARMFGISHGAAVDAIAAEITLRWPEAQDLNYFGGHDKYRRDRLDRYENAREHAQKHALFGAVTKLSATTPVVIRSYEHDRESPWFEWRDRYDITFKDGSWLSDHKDSIPSAARENLLRRLDYRQETLQDQGTLLTKIGLKGINENDMIPLLGRWLSPDGVSVNIVTALSKPKGAIGRCTSLSKLPSYDLSLPQFWDDGFYDYHHRDRSEFEPLIWAPEKYNPGIDQGDEFAAHNAASRPRLGIKLTKKLALFVRPASGEWYTGDGNLALRSQIWGSWKPDREQSNHRHNEDGEILLASQEWLDKALMQLNRRLIYTITFWKYRSQRDYDASSGVKSVFIGLRTNSGQVRLWSAKRASLQD